MNTKQKQTTQIQALLPTSPEKLWTILTDSKYTKQYMFNCAVKSNWKVGAPIIWEGHYQGYDAYQTGVILANEPLSLLKYSTFDPNYGMEDKPENYIHVSYLLEPKGKQTQLTIVNDTFDGNKERISHIREGWEMVAAEIEKLC